MFRLWRSAASEELNEQQSGVIEMKGTEAQIVSPRAGPLENVRNTQRQRRGIWPIWDISAPTAQSHPQRRSFSCTRDNEDCNQDSAQPSILDASIAQRLEWSQDLEARAADQEAGEIRSSSSPCQADCSSGENGDYYQVQMTIKIPKSVNRAAGCAEHNALIDKLQQELAEAHLRLQKALRSLNTRSKECEDLLALVRELTESRSQLTAYRSMQSERFQDLQQEYLRILRIVELSRAISKENIAKTADTTKKLNQVEEELARQRLVTQQTQERLASQKLINIDLKERLNMLERLDLLAFRRESACMIEFQRVHLKETY